MSMFYDFKGQRHEIKKSEIRSIERSGQSHDWREYIQECHKPEPRHWWQPFVKSNAASEQKQ